MKRLITVAARAEPGLIAPNPCQPLLRVIRPAVHQERAPASGAPPTVPSGTVAANFGDAALCGQRRIKCQISVPMRPR